MDERSPSMLLSSLLEYYAEHDAGKSREEVAAIHDGTLGDQGVLVIKHPKLHGNQK